MASGGIKPSDSCIWLRCQGLRHVPFVRPGGDRGAGAMERRGQPGRSATGRSVTRHEVERRAGGVRPGGRPVQSVPDHARRPGSPGASERAPRAPGLTDPAAATNGSAAEGRAKRARTPTRRRLAQALRDARTAAVEAFAAAQWAQRGPRRAASAVADSEARNEVQRGRDGDGAGLPGAPRFARAPARARRRRWGRTIPDWSDAGAEGGSSCRDGATGDGATGAAWLRFVVTRSRMSACRLHAGPAIESLSF